jgi:hypothetical protein
LIAVNAETKVVLLRLKEEPNEIQEDPALSAVAFEKEQQKQGVLQAECQKVGCQEPGL